MKLHAVVDPVKFFRRKVSEKPIKKQDDEIKLNYAGELKTAQIYDIDTRKGGQVYLFTVLVRF